MSVKIAYLGPQGTYTEQAALDYDSTAELMPYGSIPAAIAAAASGEADEAVAPIENSIEGVVTYTVDLLIHESLLKIKSEVIVPIHHCLLTQPDARIEDIRVVYSHPQAIAQCRGYLNRHLPNAEHIASLSTAGAVEDMNASRYPAAAISSRRAAELFDAHIVESNISDIPNNRTRFVALGKSDAEPTGDDKTSVCFDFAEDLPGVLYRTLGELATREINMLKIESRPDRKSMGRYVFLIDMDGHRSDAVVAEAIAAMREMTSMFRILGSNPKARV